MPHLKDPRKVLNTLANQLSSPVIVDKVKQLSEDTSEILVALDLTSAELSALNLPIQYCYGKLVKLPSNFQSEQEVHQRSEQLTGVITGMLIWIQGHETTLKTILSSFEVIHTPANIWHGHATSKDPVILLAAFTAVNPPKDQTREVDWKSYI